MNLTYLAIRTSTYVTLKLEPNLKRIILRKPKSLFVDHLSSHKCLYKPHTISSMKPMSYQHIFLPM